MKMQESKSSYKIYSRSRLNIIKGKNRRNFYKYNNKNIKVRYFLIIIFIAIFSFNILYRSVDPIFKTLCQEKVHEIATIVANEETTKVMSNYGYNDMFTIEKDDNREHKNDCCQYFYYK